MLDKMQQPKRHKLLIGTVSSAVRQKTISVQVQQFQKHPVLKKYIRSSVTYHAHDEHNQVKVGQTVMIQSCRPLSKTKRWILKKVITDKGSAI